MGNDSRGFFIPLRVLACKARHIYSSSNVANILQRALCPRVFALLASKLVLNRTLKKTQSTLKHSINHKVSLLYAFKEPIMVGTFPEEHYKDRFSTNECPFRIFF